VEPWDTACNYTVDLDMLYVILWQVWRYHVHDHVSEYDYVSFMSCKFLWNVLVTLEDYCSRTCCRVKPIVPFWVV
jgi:hypothetical protein